MSPPCKAQALLVQSDTDNCCSRFPLVSLVELPLLVGVICDDCNFKGKGDQTPNVSTTSEFNHTLLPPQYLDDSGICQLPS